MAVITMLLTAPRLNLEQRAAPESPTPEGGLRSVEACSHFCSPRIQYRRDEVIRPRGRVPFWSTQLTGGGTGSGPAH